MRAAIVLAFALVGCVGTHRYACDTRRNCAGEEVLGRGITVDTYATAFEIEVELVDACEAMACDGALACSAVCRAVEP